MDIPRGCPVRESEPVWWDALFAEENDDLIGGVLTGDRLRDLPEDKVAQVVAVILIRVGGGRTTTRFRARSCPEGVKARS